MGLTGRLTETGWRSPVARYPAILFSSTISADIQHHLKSNGSLAKSTIGSVTWSRHPGEGTGIRHLTITHYKGAHRDVERDATVDQERTHRLQASTDAFRQTAEAELGSPASRSGPLRHKLRPRFCPQSLSVMRPSVACKPLSDFASRALALFPSVEHVSSTCDLGQAQFQPPTLLPSIVG